uniref:Uncharacterized protein n=1 Tax=Pithovirus LCDPAC02 TaxID=2506601 RepID=A0A481YPF5_9VIRU|nr:MAG: hypothetical protein LCDPAC02_01190 [Pithovirus LCDPAC02]
MANTFLELGKDIQNSHHDCIKTNIEKLSDKISEYNFELLYKPINGVGYIFMHEIDQKLGYYYIELENLDIICIKTTKDKIKYWYENSGSEEDLPTNFPTYTTFLSLEEMEPELNIIITKFWKSLNTTQEKNITNDDILKLGDYILGSFIDDKYGNEGTGYYKLTKSLFKFVYNNPEMIKKGVDNLISSNNICNNNVDQKQTKIFESFKSFFLQK